MVIFTVPRPLYPVSYFMKSTRQSLPSYEGRGKSGLHRAECRLTTGRREAMESATESLTADGPYIWGSGKGEMVR